MFVLVPMGFAVYYSMFRWRGVGPPTDFVGFNNYVLAFQDPIFIDALRNNAVIVVGSLLIQGPIALGIALLLNRQFRGRTIFRLLVFVPYVLAEVTAGIMWKLILTDGGTVDALMRSVGLGGLVRPWLADLDLVIWTLLFVLTWKYVGFAIILLLAGLSNVPQELTEAAAIDGASWWQTQRHVTLPLLGPTFRIWMFLSMIGSLQVFDVIWVTSVPAVRSLGASATMATYMVDNGFFARLWGYGNAVAVILFAISFVAAVLFQRFLLRRDIEGAITRRAN
ncbi:sugar ABC transporter permease [Solwaraspora sp. WMMD1047]|uniref:carbohydrate ABC transporter permease n=1 Tax=Solwaraspora sp. WMMD1047 TaxID=3016102 RepID=UPI00241660A1|nr:sugar ABC transporter permease [Solwaraspora sp. WMMD1047]MDG4832556.1 sugar ABC transporter permease [Solwaraspora sp. WMMD1047]